MFIKYSTGQIPPKKSRGKGSQGKNSADTPEVDIDVSEDLTLNLLENKLVVEESSRRKSQFLQKTTSFMSQTLLWKEDHQVFPKDTSDVSKKMSPNPSQKLKGVQTLEEQVVIDTMQTLKASRKSSRSKSLIGGSSEGTGVSPGVPNESTVIPATLSEGTGSEQESEYSEEDQGDDESIPWVYTNEDEEKKNDDDDKSVNLEKTDNEETDDEFVHSGEYVQTDDEETDDEVVQGDEQVNDDEDEEMTNAEDADTGNDDEEITDAEKADAEKAEEVKDDIEKAKLPKSRSSLSVSSDAGINSLLDITIQQEIPLIQSPYVLNVHVSVIFEPSILTPIPETPSVAPAITLLPPPSVSTIPHALLQMTTPILTPPIITDTPTITTVVPEFDSLTVLQRHTTDLIQKYSVKPTLEPSKIQTPTTDLEPKSEKSALEIRKIKKEQDDKQKMPKYTIKSTDKAALKEYDQKSALYQTMNENKTFNRNPSNHALYHALMEALIEDENAMDKGVADTVKNHKRQHDDDEDDEDPSAGPNQGKKTKRRRTKESESYIKPSTTKETSKGKAPSKSSKTSKSATTQEPIEELITEVVMDDIETNATEDVVNDTDRPQDDLALKTNKPSRDTWFK
ncbi:hypothetical protein Tco_0128313 [Tanacetum coccineum]